MRTVRHHDYALIVDAWLDRSAKDVTPEELIQLFEAALGALFRRTLATLGDVTLTAITDRVLHGAAQTCPAFSTVRIESSGDVRCVDLRALVGRREDPHLREGIRSVIAEFIRVLGKLTADILTSDLFTELDKVGMEAVRAQCGVTTQPHARQDAI